MRDILPPSLLAGACVVSMLVGCGRGSSNVVWRESFPSPDGRWVATATTIQNGGFGSAHIDTTVALKPSTGGTDQTVLALECDGPIKHPYVLDNESNRGGSVDLTVRWESAVRLLISFNNHARAEYQSSEAGPVSVVVKSST